MITLTELLSFPDWLINFAIGLLLITIGSLFGSFDEVSSVPISKRSFRCRGTRARLRKGLMIAFLVTGIGIFAHSVLTRAGI